MKFLEYYTQEEILKYFYISGVIIFLIVGISNSYTNFINWDNMILSAKISTLFMNIFNYILAIFFYSLLKGKGDKIIDTDLKLIEDKEAEEIFKGAKNG